MISCSHVDMLVSVLVSVMEAFSLDVKIAVDVTDCRMSNPAKGGWSTNDSDILIEDHHISSCPQCAPVLLHMFQTSSYIGLIQPFSFYGYQ